MVALEEGEMMPTYQAIYLSFASPFEGVESFLTTLHMCTGPVMPCHVDDKSYTALIARNVATAKTTIA
jgi:hypothetical protein